jgi:hypothetical protein
VKLVLLFFSPTGTNGMARKNKVSCWHYFIPVSVPQIKRFGLYCF